jgi:hypothetical protein
MMDFGAQRPRGIAPFFRGQGENPSLTRKRRLHRQAIEDQSIFGIITTKVEKPATASTAVVSSMRLQATIQTRGEKSSRSGCMARMVEFRGCVARQSASCLAASSFGDKVTDDWAAPCPD